MKPYTHFCPLCTDQPLGYNAWCPVHKVETHEVTQTRPGVWSFEANLVNTNPGYNVVISLSEIEDD